MSGDGILRHAQNSADQYNAAQIKENTILSNYLDYINKYNPNGEKTPGGEDPDPDVWDYAWICTETTTDGNTTRALDNTMYTPATLPANAEYVIIAKFYKNEDQEKMTINGVEDYPYTMKIEGSGAMPSLRDNERNSYCWYKQLTEYSGTGEVVIAFTTKIEINKEITHIGDRAFEMAMSLSEINYKGTKTDWDNVTIGEDVFEGVPSTAKIICSDGTEISIGS